MLPFTVATLQAKCFKQLVSNFEQYITALEFENSWSKKRFLQVKFSDMLLEKLEGPLTKKHASIFINQYLKKLNLNRFLIADIDDIIEILKLQGEGILCVHFYNSIVLEYRSSTLLKLVRSLPSTLTSLHLPHTNCCDEVLKVVAETCMNLQHLDLCGCEGVTDMGIKSFLYHGDQSVTKSLLTIDLNYTDVTTQAIDWILNCCPNLKTLSHKHVEYALSNIYRRYTNNNHSQFKHYNLESINCIKATNLKAIRALCPHVKFLSVTGITQQSEISTCGEFEKLKIVEFVASDHSISSVSFFKSRGSKLEEITIVGFIFSVKSLTQFCPKIRRLSLNHIKFEKIKTGADSNLLRDLRILDISNVNLMTEMQHLGALFAQSPHIETINFAFVSGFTHSFVKFMGKSGISNLKNMTINISHVENSVLEELVLAAPNLEQLHLRDCEAFEDCMDLEMLKDGLVVSYNEIFDGSFMEF